MNCQPNRVLVLANHRLVMKQEAQSAWNIGWMVSMLQLGYSLEDGLQCQANPRIVELNPNLQPKLPGTTGWITGDTTGGNHIWCMLYCMCIQDGAPQL